MLVLIDSTASATPAQSDRVPSAMVAATALLRCDEAAGVAAPWNPASKDLNEEEARSPERRGWAPRAMKFGTEARLDMNRIPYTYMRERITRAGKFCRNGRQDWGVGTQKMAKSRREKNSFPLFSIFYTLFTSPDRF
jgi:hypothetical protein